MDEQKNSGVSEAEPESAQEPYNSVTITISSTGSIGRTLIEVVEALKSIRSL